MSNYLSMVKAISVIGLLLMLSSCMTTLMAVNCIDAQIPRADKVVTHEVTIERLDTGERFVEKIACNWSYSSQCGAIGSSWSSSRVDKSIPLKVEFHVEGRPSIKVYSPYCFEKEYSRTWMPKNVYTADGIKLCSAEMKKDYTEKYYRNIKEEDLQMVYVHYSKEPIEPYYVPIKITAKFISSVKKNNK